MSALVKQNTLSKRSLQFFKLSFLQYQKRPHSRILYLACKYVLAHAELKQLSRRADLIQLQFLIAQMHLRKWGKCASTAKFRAQTQTCHLLEHTTGFSKKRDHGPLKTFISQRHTALARQEAMRPCWWWRSCLLGTFMQAEACHLISRDHPPFGTAIWIPKCKTGPPNCMRLNVNSVQWCPETRTSCPS